MSDTPTNPDHDPAGAQFGGDAVGGDKSERDTYKGRTVNVNNYNYARPFAADPDTRAERRLREDRTDLITAVRQVWIEGVLKPAVDDEMYIDLGLTTDRRAVARPVHTLLPDREPLPAGTSLRDVFDGNRRKLLILGEPAAGKTISLLTLADSLLETATEVPTVPVPVVLNLSSWSADDDDLLPWLAEALFTTYKMSRQAGREWVTAGRLILLLDGLDEVGAARRADCLQAINEFLAEHGLPLAVCSRVADYEKLPHKLHAAAAVVIEPLTPTQIDRFLAGLGETAAGLRRAVAHSEPLQKLAASPLMLSLMPVAYADETPNELTAADTVDENRDRLLAAYVDRVFERKPLTGVDGYAQADALRWLAYLAHGMQVHNRGRFYLGELQPSWLTTRRSRWWAKSIFRLMSIGVVFGLSEDDVYVSGWQRLTIPPLQEWWGVVKKMLKGAITFGAAFGVSMILSRWLSELFTGGDWQGRISEDLNMGLGAALLGSIMGLIGGLVRGLVTISPLPQKPPYPNYYLLQPRLDILMGGVIIALIIGLLQSLEGNVSDALIFMLGLVLLLGVTTSVRNAMIHYTIRDHLARQDLLPFYFSGFKYPDSEARWPDRDLVGFLDKMVDRWLLYRVGAGWEFRHRYLLEYFAARSPVELDPPTKS